MITRVGIETCAVVMLNVVPVPPAGMETLAGRHDQMGVAAHKRHLNTARRRWMQQRHAVPVGKVPTPPTTLSAERKPQRIGDNPSELAASHGVGGADECRSWRPAPTPS